MSLYAEQGVDTGSLIKGVIGAAVPGAGDLWNFADSLSSPDDSQHWVAKDWPWWIDEDNAHNPAKNFLPFLRNNQDFFNIDWDDAPNSGRRLTVKQKVERTVTRMTAEGLGSETKKAIDLIYPNGFNADGSPASKSSTIFNMLPTSDTVRKAGIGGLLAIVALIGIAITFIVRAFKPRKGKGKHPLYVIGFLLISTSILNAQVSNNGVKQLAADWNSNGGVTFIRNKPPRGLPNGYAPLNGSGLISAAFLPSLNYTHTYVYTSQAAMLAGSAVAGDIAIRTDSVGLTLILVYLPASNRSNWIRPNPASETDPVYTASTWWSTANNAANWNTAYGWGDHSVAGYSTASNTQTFTNKIWNGAPIGNVYLTNSSLSVNGTSIALGGSGALSLASANFANQGTTTGLLHGNASGNPSWGQVVNADIANSTIVLTSKVTGVLPIANGGTGSSSQNFVDLSSTQSVAGQKTFTGSVILNPSAYSTRLNSVAGFNGSNGFAVGSLNNASNDTYLSSILGDVVLLPKDGAGGGGSGTVALRAFGPTSNVQVGSSTTDRGYKLDVQGTSKFTSRSWHSSINLNKDSVSITAMSGAMNALGVDTVTGDVKRYVAPASGTYTPTITNITGITSVTAYSCQWMQVGNVVTVSGMLAYNTTSTIPQFTMSLPVATTSFGSSTLAGTANGFSVTDQITRPFRVMQYGDGTAYFHCVVSANSASYETTFQFTYRTQ